jgi:hypothetical protein
MNSEKLKLGLPPIWPQGKLRMLDIDETIDAFRCGALDIDCKRMVLAQHKESGERFEGQGYIRQADGGRRTAAH